jgi:hypothetical protein
MLMIDGLAISIIIILMGLLVPISSTVRSDRLKSIINYPQWQHPLSVIFIYSGFCLNSAVFTRLYAPSRMATLIAGAFIMSIKVGWHPSPLRQA